MDDRIRNKRKIKKSGDTMSDAELETEILEWAKEYARKKRVGTQS